MDDPKIQRGGAVDEGITFVQLLTTVLRLGSVMTTQSVGARKGVSKAV